MSKVLLIAVAVADDADIGQPVRQLLDAVAEKRGRPAHVSLHDVDELDHDQLAQAFAPDNPDAFQTVE